MRADQPWRRPGSTMQRIATHILARRRHAVSGRFGLRATPGGIGTPAFGAPDALEVVRTSGTSLVHELGGQVQVLPIAGATLADLAAMVDVDLTADFTVGNDTADVGDLDAPHPARRRRSGRAGGLVRPRLASPRHHRTHAPTAPAPIQLWPEHFDASCLLAIGSGAERSLRRRRVPGRPSPRRALPLRRPVGDPPSGRPGVLERILRSAAAPLRGRVRARRRDVLRGRPVPTPCT